jgi:hypothetical protein
MQNVPGSRSVASRAQKLHSILFFPSHITHKVKTVTARYTMSMLILWVVMPYGLVIALLTLKMETVCLSETHHPS